MAHVPKMALGIHYRASLISFLILPDQLLNIVKNTCVCVCVCVYVHISDCVEFVYQFPLLPDNTASETFSHKSGAVRSVDRIFTIGCRAGGDRANT